MSRIVFALPDVLMVDRRQFLKLALLAAAPAAWRSGAALAQPKTGTDPFTLGVASGPGAAGGVALWTRLASHIQADIERISNLSTELYVSAREKAPPPAPAIDVRWEIAEDESFRTIVRRGTAVALPELAHSVHVEVDGLATGRWHYYRFLAGDAASPVGRTRVFGNGGATPARFRFGVASCQHYEWGHFGAYAHLRADDPDAVLFAGDYIYEGGPRERRFRTHPFPSARSLFDYRMRHALYKLDPDLQRLHAHCPWLLTWDDHEVSNDYAGDIGEDPAVEGAARRAAAYQAYYEHMPLPAATLVQRFSHVRIYRRVNFGALAAVTLLDDRQYRDRQACQPAGRGGSSVIDDEACAARRDPARTLLGAEQMAWLARTHEQGNARWNLIAQQSLFSQLLRDPVKRRFWSDGWDGYPAERARVLAALARANVRNPVIFGGDVHSTWVCDVKSDFDDGKSPTVATEFCGTSVTSPASASEGQFARAQAINGHVRFVDGARRGYLLAELTPQMLSVKLRAIDDATKRAPAISTVAAWTVADGKPGAI